MRLLMTQTTMGFYVASIVFWGSFFAIQRGCPKELLSPLYHQLVSNNPFFINASDSVKADRESSFIEVHNAWLNFFFTNVKTLCNEWMTTSAGTAWLAEVNRQRSYPPRSEQYLTGIRRRHCINLMIQSKSVLSPLKVKIKNLLGLRWMPTECGISGSQFW